MFHNRTEVGLLHLFVQPLYAQSRDCTADMANVNQLKPNAHISPKKETRTDGEGASIRDEAASSPVQMAPDSEAGNVAPPQLRKNERVLNQGQGNTIRSVSSSQRNTLRSSFTSGGSSIPGVDGPSSERFDVLQVDFNDNVASPSVHSHATSPLSPVMERQNYVNSMQDPTKQAMSSAHSSLKLDPNLNLNPNPNLNPNLGQELNQDTSLDQNLDNSLDMMDVNMNNYPMANPNLHMGVDQSPSSNLSPNPSSVSSRSLRGEPATAHVEIKKVAIAMVAPSATSEEPKYISQCQAIIRKSQSMYKQGVHLISRPRNDYVENMKFVL